jgi:hypothetical protein
MEDFAAGSTRVDPKLDPGHGDLSEAERRALDGAGGEGRETRATV